MKKNGRISEFLTGGLALGLVAYRLVKHSPNSSKRVVTGKTETLDYSLPAQSEPRTVPERRKRHSGLTAIYRLFSKSASQFLDDDCTTLAAALAYYTTFSIAPLLLIIISIVGLVFERQAVQHQIQTQIEGLIGQGTGSQIGAMVQNAGQHASTGILGAVLGILTLIFGATGAFTQLQSSLNWIWRLKPDPQAGGIRNFIGHRILSLGMVLGVAFLLLVSLAVSAALSGFGNMIAGFLPRALSGPVLMGIGFVVSLAIVTLLFAAIFKVLPDAEIEWRHVWVGAGVTAVLFSIGKFLIGMYLGHSGTASAYGAAGSFVLIVLWIYYSALILLFGAELTVRWAEAHSGEVKPKAGAVRVTEEPVEPKRAA